MNFCLSIAFTLLAGVAGMYLLAKTRAEQLGKLFSIASYLVILIASLSLIWQLGTAACWMACGSGICQPTESCMPGKMMHGMSGHYGMNSGCKDMDKCCSSKGRSEGRKECEMERGSMNKSGRGQGCDEMMEDNDDGGQRMMQKDSAPKK